MPVFKTRAIDPANRGSSGSLAIDSLSRAEAQQRGDRSATSPPTPSEQAKARRWTGSRLERDADLRRAVLGSLAQAGRPSRSPAGSAARPATRSSAMRPSTASSTPRSAAPTTTPGATICPAPRASAAAAATAAAARPASSRAASPCSSGPPPPPTADPRSLGSRPHALRQIRPGHPRLHERHSRAHPRHQAAQQGRRAHRRAAPRLLQPHAARARARPSPSTTAPSSPATTASTTLAIQTFFCDPHAPWQKGGIENAIGRLRRFIAAQDRPRYHSTDRRFLAFIAAYNTHPAKVP